MDQEPDAIYIQKPSRRRYLAFGFMTMASLAIIGGVWFYMMENIITNAAQQGLKNTEELEAVVEDFKAQKPEGISQHLDEVIQDIGRPVAPTPDPTPDTKEKQNALEAATGVIKENVLAETGAAATSDLAE